MTEQEIKEEKEYLKEHVKTSYSNAFYAMQRIDLLIISISGAAVYICLEIIKMKPPVTNVMCFKITGAVLISAIISNFLSQMFSFKANLIDSHCKDLMIKQFNLDESSDEYKTQDKVITHQECIASIYDKGTKITNLLSVSLMIVGLIMIITFISIFL
jgi:hypothetical protein